MDILEVVNSAVRTLDQKTIALGSTCAYKNSNNLQVDSKFNEKVPRESVYDTEMYRILLNWLAKVHNFEITSQWHLEQICEDGDYHHLYCDLTIKKSDDPYPLNSWQQHPCQNWRNILSKFLNMLNNFAL